MTLLLSGKNPCYVDSQCDINTTARRITWARFHNAGQSAVAPDYILCHVDAKDDLLQALRCALLQFYGTDPRESRSFGRMVNEEIFNKAKDQLWRSGKVFIGGQVNDMERYIGEWKQCGIARYFFIKILIKSSVLMAMIYICGFL